MPEAKQTSEREGHCKDPWCRILHGQANELQLAFCHECVQDAILLLNRRS